MPIRFISGDLFDNEHGARTFAHGCNCQGSMGAGIAKTFRARYPQMYEEYRRRCKAEPRRFNLGDCWLWKADDQPWVFNLGTQEGYWRSRASYEAIETALKEMRRQADAEGITSIAMPRIGVGYGGLSWKKVRAIIEAVFGDWPGSLIVYEEFVPGKSAKSTSSPDDRPPARTSSTSAVSDTPGCRDNVRRRTKAAPGADEQEGGGHDERDQLLLGVRGLRLLLELLTAPDRPQGRDLANQRALFPGAEVRWHARRGGGPAGEVADDRRPAGP
jgi:O-acetyl-ADP-ribose deacetylase (regulator of RNase III)